jgi:hypothetical protein
VPDPTWISLGALAVSIAALWTAIASRYTDRKREFTEYRVGVELQVFRLFLNTSRFRDKLRQIARSGVVPADNPQLKLLIDRTESRVAGMEDLYKEFQDLNALFASHRMRPIYHVQLHEIEGKLKVLEAKFEEYERKGAELMAMTQAKKKAEPPTKAIDPSDSKK